MAGLIRREDIDLVRTRTDIKEVIEQHVSLRGSGVNSFKGLCPFHEERTPSFSVNAALGHYHCFGCGASGDVFKFVQEVEHLSFAEAVTKLAAAAGIEVQYEDGSSHDASQYSKRQRLLDLHKVASEFYAEQLSSPAARLARQFLADRGFDRSAAELFGVGFAPRGWDHMLKHARARGFIDEQLRASGIFSSKEGARSLYDRFRGRLIWPIRGVTGETVGFGARKLFEEDPGPKYLNTPETVLYRKSQVLYGLDVARHAIAKERTLVVVEGYTDVMACHLAGVPYAVATCGTAFGPDHVRLIQRLLSHDRSGEVIFTFDGDEAGQQAALRAFELDQQFLASTYVAVDPSGLDPCEVRMHSGAAGIRQLLAARAPLVEFALRAEVAKYENQLGSIEGRLVALRAVAAIIGRIPDPLAREHYALRIAGWLGILDPTEVTRAVARARTSETSAVRGTSALHLQGPERTGVNRSGSQPQRVELERQLLEVLIQYPHVCTDKVWELARELTFTHPSYAEVFDVLSGLHASSDQSTFKAGEPSQWLHRLLEGSRPSLRESISELALGDIPVREEDLPRYSVELLRRLRGYRLRAHITDKLAQLQRLDPTREATQFRRLQVELMELQRELHALGEK